MEVIENMRETARKTVDLLSLNLHSSCRKAAEDKTQMRDSIAMLVLELRDRAVENTNRFDIKISEIEEKIATLNSISDSISLKSSFQEIKQKLKTLEEIRRTIREILNDNIYFESYGISTYGTYTKFTRERQAIWFNSKVASGEK